MTATKELPPLYVRLFGDGANFNQFIDNSIGKLDKFAGAATRWGQKASFALTAPIAIMEAMSVSAFGKFNENMVNSVSIMQGVSDETQRQMEDTAKQLSMKSRQGAADLAEGYYFLASAGRDAESAMASLPAVASFATAGQVNLAKATELLADAQSALGLRGKDAAEDMMNMVRVSDVLTVAGNLSNASIEQFADALTNKSAAALRSFGKTVEEGASVLMVYADQGTKGVLAGEKLNTMYRELGQSFIRENAAWKLAGLTIYDTNGKMKTTADLVEMMEGKLRGMTDQQKMSTLQQLGFNGELLGSMLPLLGLSGKLREYEEAVTGVGGATQAVADKQMKSFNAQMDLMYNKINVVRIEIGETLVPHIMWMNSMLDKAINVWFDLSEGMRATVIHTAHFAAMVPPLILGMAGLAKATSGMLGITKQLMPYITQSLRGVQVGLYAVRAASMSALLPLLPYIAIAAAVAAAVAAIGYVILGPEGMAQAFWDTHEYVTALWEATQGFFYNFTENAGLASTWFSENWQAMFLDAGEIILRFIAAGIANQVVMWQTYIRLGVAFVGWLTTAVPAAYNYVFCYEFLVAVLDGLEKVMSAFDQWFTANFNAFKVWANGVMVLMQEVAGEIGQTFMQLSAEIGTVLTDLMEGKLPNPAEIMARMIKAAGPRVEAAMLRVGASVAAGMEVVEKQYKEGMAMLQGDFNKGAGDMNFANTAASILAEQQAKLTNPLAGFQSRTTPLPGFNTALPGQADPGSMALVMHMDAAQPMDEFAGLKKMHDDLNEPIKLKVQSDFDAVAGGSAAAFDRLAAFANSKGEAYTGMGKRAGTTAKGPVAGPTQADRTAAYDKAVEAQNKALGEIAKNTAKDPSKNVVEISNAQLTTAAGA